MENINPISEKIREVRRNKNLTIIEVAEKLNISKATLSEIERGTRQFDFDKLKDIAKALGVDVSELIPQYIDAGRCIKMPPYTKKEVDSLKLNWEQSLHQSKDQQVQVKKKKNGIASISIDTSDMDISEILTINKCVTSLEALKEENYSNAIDFIKDMLYTLNAKDTKAILDIEEFISNELKKGFVGAGEVSIPKLYEHESIDANADNKSIDADGVTEAQF